MPCYVTRTSRFLPGQAVDNESIETYLGSLDGEVDVKSRVLAMNGIKQRHYAQDTHQRPTFDVYHLAVEAMRGLQADDRQSPDVTFLSAGTTYAPLAGPGIASIIHHRAQSLGIVDRPIEISSHAGICTSASAAMVAAIRAVNSGEHRAAICIGAEHASEVLKSSVIRPIDDRSQHAELRNSQWFMAVFLRFMLSDGAGAFLLSDQPSDRGVSLKVNWTHSMSFANETPLCMKLDNASQLLSQDITILSRHLVPCSHKLLADAWRTHDDCLNNYSMILPHMSSFFFRKKMERTLKDYWSHTDRPVPYWTNLETVGNTGAASIYVMLDQYLRMATLQDGQKLMLFIPESGQFNFVLVSLTAIVR